ncbi:MAG: glutamine-hydrolyzing carbamoyl-phosphate synthase small subunit [Coriobacteriales bacterium]|nr:glutamine-hydrolyzing carbamoyl-phosphate synthase small subunit [Coriobacteriales bacterium]
MLEDGTVFKGKSCGAAGEAYGELCFNTSLVGYLEVISDPSYAGQIVTMTYPQIGNYGVSRADLQREKLALSGLVVRDICYTPSNFRSELSLPDFLVAEGVVAICEVDTRALTQHLRDKGAMKAVISTVTDDAQVLLGKVRASASILAKNLASTVSVSESYHFQADHSAYDFLLKRPQAKRFKVVVYDCGAKTGILRNLERAGVDITVVPWNTPAACVLQKKPDGVFFSNGPGDPEPVRETYEAARELLGKVPVFGICLGHQMISLAAGAQIQKLKFGHHGGNHPVMNLLTGTVEITAQNHGFSLVFSSLGPLIACQSGGFDNHEDVASDNTSSQDVGIDASAEDLRIWVKRGIAPVVQSAEHGRIQLTHVNLNDGTPEGIAFLDLPAFSVQYHPEASPGPTDSHYLFTAFTRLMQGRSDYLDIDISKDRLSEWR